MRKFTLMALLGVFLTVLCTPVFMAETEAPPNQPQKITLSNFNNPVQGVSLSVAKDLKQKGMVRLRLERKNIIETYLINTRQKLPKVLKYSALKPDNDYGIRLETLMIKPPGYDHYASYQMRQMPAKVNFHKFAMRQLE